MIDELIERMEEPGFRIVLRDRIRQLVAAIVLREEAMEIQYLDGHERRLDPDLGGAVDDDGHGVGTTDRSLIGMSSAHHRGEARTASVSARRWRR